MQGVARADRAGVAPGEDKNDLRRLDDPRDFVRQEISLALELGKKVVPVLFDETPMPRSEQLPGPLAALPNFDALMIRGKTYEYDAQLAELVRLLAKVPGMPEPQPADEPGKRILRFAEDLLSEHFCGREAELGTLEEALRGEAAVTSPPVAIHGMGGCGKTQLALKYAIEHQDRYAGIWWFRAERPELLEAGFEVFCVDCAAPRDKKEAPFAAATRWLSRQPAWLLVFDNADTPEQLRPYLKPFRENRELTKHQLIITSRNPDWSGVATAVHLRTWTPEQAAVFLRSRMAGSEQREALSLAKRLGGLPLALE